MVFLKHKSNPPAAKTRQLRLWHCEGIGVIQPHRSAGRMIKRSEDIEQSAFARTARPDNRQRITCSQLKIHIAQDQQWFGGRWIFLAHVADAQCLRLAHRRTPWKMLSIPRAICSSVNSR